MKKYLDSIQSSYIFQKLKSHWLTVAFIGGFILDNITLNQVDQLFDNIVLLLYVILAMASMLFFYAGVSSKFSDVWNYRFRTYAPAVTQYAFGGLLSGMLIFYGRSGSWSESWPFLLIIVAVIYGNETIKDRSTRFVFNLAIFYVGLFSYIVLVVPVFTGFMGAWVFVGSGVLSLLILRVFIYLLHFIIPHFLELEMRKIIFVIGSIFASLNFLYFTNIIPPIPLSLKDLGIYHSVVRFDDGRYQLKYEEGKWWQFWRDSDDVFRPTVGGNVFCFAEVFAPAKIATDIYHRWEYYDESIGEWRTHTRLSYPISGGRDQGYRGYTLIENYRDGKWRCSVETARGQVLGREAFILDSSNLPGELITKLE